MIENNHNPKVIEKAKKLLALAEKGVAGEKQTAERFLARFLAKHGLSLDELVDEKIEEHRIKIKGTSLHQNLLHQIIYSVNRNCELFGFSHSRSQFMIEATKADFIEIELKYQIYSKSLDVEYKRMQDEFLEAFIHSNEIYAKEPKPDKADADERHIDPERMARIAVMSNSIDKVSVNPQLEHKG